MKYLIGALISVAGLALVLGAIFYKPTHTATAAERAEQRYGFLTENGASGEERCTAARAVESAYADAGDAGNYRSSKQTADQECTSAELERRLAL